MLDNTNTEYANAELMEHCYCILLRLMSCVGLTPIWSNFRDVYYLSDTSTYVVILITGTSDLVRFTPIW